MVGRYEESVAAFKRSIEISEKANVAAYQIYLRLATTYSMMGREEDARELVIKARELNPKITLDSWCKNQFYRDPEHTYRPNSKMMDS